MSQNGSFLNSYKNLKFGCLFFQNQNNVSISKYEHKKFNSNFLYSSTSKFTNGLSMTIESIQIGT